MQKNYCLKKKHNNKGGFCSLFELFLNKSSMNPAGFPANAGCLTADRKYRKKRSIGFREIYRKLIFAQKRREPATPGKPRTRSLNFSFFLRFFFKK